MIPQEVDAKQWRVAGLQNEHLNNPLFVTFACENSLNIGRVLLCAINRLNSAHCVRERIRMLEDRERHRDLSLEAGVYYQRNLKRFATLAEE